MPKKRTPTIATSNTAIEGCRAAVEMSQLDVPMSATLEPIVRLPSSTESATQPHEPCRKDKRRKKTDWPVAGVAFCESTTNGRSSFWIPLSSLDLRPSTLDV